MLSLAGVGKEYDLRPVLTDVTIQLQPGSGHLLTAPNGSGKTTLLKLMAGLSRPSHGTVLWAEQHLGKLARQQTGVVLQQPFLFGELTGYENLLLYAKLFGMDDPRNVARMWLRRMNMEDASDDLVKAYSKGMKQRLSLARALLATPKVLLLDEPYDGLDADAHALFDRLIRELRNVGTAVFMVSHHVADFADADVHHTLCFGRLVSI